MILSRSKILDALRSEIHTPMDGNTFRDGYIDGRSSLAAWLYAAIKMGEFDEVADIIIPEDFPENKSYPDD